MQTFLIYGDLASRRLTDFTGNSTTLPSLVQGDVATFSLRLLDSVETGSPIEVQRNVRSLRASIVRADPVRLHQVFWNLVRNALKFTPSGGKLYFHTANEAASLKIEITDTGVGITPEVMPRIFEAFEQGEQIKTRRFGGLGLGLCIAKKVIEIQRGTIAAFSKGKDQGATFTVVLPTVLPRSTLIKIVAPAQARGQVAAASIQKQQPRILLVEDDHETMRILSRLLQRSGYQVTTADSVQKALQQYTAGKFDVVVSDIGLPDGTELELMEQIKNQNGPPGIALSGYGTEDDIRRSHAAGFETHFVKPIDFKALRSAIEQIRTVS